MSRECNRRLQLRRPDDPVPDYIDHINGDPTDNRITNLRPATAAQNAWNLRSQKGRSGFKGVFLDARSGRFVARIKAHGKQVWLKSFTNPVEAAYVYDMASLEFHGEYGQRNFLPLLQTLGDLK